MDAGTILAVTVGGVLVTSLAVWFSISLAHKFGVHDHPDSMRKTQEHPIPKLGGLAVAIAFSAVALVGLTASGNSDLIPLALAVILPALMAATIGYIDDLRHLQPIIRLALQAVFGLLAWSLGTRAEVTGFVLADLTLTVLFIMLVVNGINLLDNSDGLAGSTVLVSALGASVIAVMFGQELVSLLGFALVGVCIGFLWHNWYPARVYMGDSGAYFLGFLLASLVIRLTPTSVPRLLGVAIALLLVALPLLDTLFVVVRRMMSGVHPFTAGRDHLSHVIQGSGRSTQVSVLSLQVAAVLFALLAVTVASVARG
jgi:UDP-GlcNAc:undecaprenyl-phosphate GlcNAc-1-phosphate transferase